MADIIPFPVRAKSLAARGAALNARLQTKMAARGTAHLQQAYMDAIREYERDGNTESIRALNRARTEFFNSFGGSFVGENTKIEWADHSWNPWTGCQKVGPGCDNCYAERWAKRSGLVEWGPHAVRRMTADANWRKPLKWNEAAKAAGRADTVFCASLADVFDNKAPPGAQTRLFELVRETPNLIWLLLTKRIGNVQFMLPLDWGDGYDNVCLMITVVTQEEADRDIEQLARLPARWRGLSMEPLLESVNLAERLTGIDWVIVGGESGHGARHMEPGWARSLRDQCARTPANFFMKQMTGKAPIPDDLMVRQFFHK